MEQARSFMYKLVQGIEEVDALAAALTGTPRVILSSTTVHMPNFCGAEVGFLRAVAWLYVVFNETARIHVRFLLAQLESYDQPLFEVVSRLFQDVQHLRTFLQHNLRPDQSRDMIMLKQCEEWFIKCCGTALPGDEGVWRKCLIELLNDALTCVDALKKCVRSIENDSDKDVVVKAWARRINRYHPPHEFESLIGISAGDMGRESIDPQRLCKQFYSAWTKQLDVLCDDYVFETEARKLIEFTLLQDMHPVLPITGKDIMLSFGILPGRKVGDLLEKAKVLQSQQVLSKDELLRRLVDENRDAVVSASMVPGGYTAVRQQHERITNMQRRVFISYSSVDQEQADRLAEICNEIGITYFLDRKDVKWGDDVGEEIAKGVTASTDMIVIISPASLKSQWVPYEIGQASGQGKPILPYLTHPSLSLPSYLQKLHYTSDLQAVRDYLKEEVPPPLLTTTQRFQASHKPLDRTTAFKLVASGVVAGWAARVRAAKSAEAKKQEKDALREVLGKYTESWNMPTSVFDFWFEECLAKEEFLTFEELSRLLMAKGVIDSLDASVKESVYVWMLRYIFGSFSAEQAHGEDH